MNPEAHARLAELLAPRCAVCRDVVPSGPAVNFGDLIFHVTCGPRCIVCERSLGRGEGGWRSEGKVISEAWGWAVQPGRFWCPECLGNAPRDEPRGNF